MIIPTDPIFSVFISTQLKMLQSKSILSDMFQTLNLLSNLVKDMNLDFVFRIL